MFCHNNKAFLFACKKDAVGAALKKVAPALGSGQQKIGSGSTLKVAATGGSGSATLLASDEKMFIRESEEYSTIEKLTLRGRRQKENNPSSLVIAQCPCYSG